jgi:hypothetical protein
MLKVRFGPISGAKADVAPLRICAKALNRGAIARCGVRLVHEHNNQGGDRS